MELGGDGGEVRRCAGGEEDVGGKVGVVGCEC